MKKRETWLEDPTARVMEPFFFGFFFTIEGLNSTNYDQKQMVFLGIFLGCWYVGMLLVFFLMTVTVSVFGFGILFRCGFFGYFGDTLLLTFAWDTLIHSRGFLLCCSRESSFVLPRRE